MRVRYEPQSSAGVNQFLMGLQKIDCGERLLQIPLRDYLPELEFNPFVVVFDDGQFQLTVQTVGSLRETAEQVFGCLVVKGQNADLGQQ